jgi:hypothetical protein
MWMPDCMHTLFLYSFSPAEGLAGSCLLTLCIIQDHDDLDPLTCFACFVDQRIADILAGAPA